MLSASSAFAQNPSTSALRPNTDQSATTGLGSNSRLKTVPPAPVILDNSRSVFWYTPETAAKPQAEEQEDKAEIAHRRPAPPPPAAQVQENPSTTITRDRIESPRH